MAVTALEPLALIAEDCAGLTRLVESGSAREAQRTRIVLACADPAVRGSYGTAAGLVRACAPRADSACSRGRSRCRSGARRLDGTAAMAVGAFDLAAGFLAISAAGGRDR